MSGDEELKNILVALLKPFYEVHSNYGPNVTIALLSCMEQLCKVISSTFFIIPFTVNILFQEDPGFQFSCWADKEIVRYLPEFLCSDYQEVRFRAIEAIITFYSTCDNPPKLTSFHRQEEIFEKLYEYVSKLKI